MYRVLRASILYYENYMRGQKARYELIAPFMLIVDRKRFIEEEHKKSREYLNLCDIVSKMRFLFSTGEVMYHHFGMLLEELQILGFNVKDMQASYTTEEDRLKEQIDLLLQFLSFRYPFDEFDNKTGVHDSNTGEFIFIQP